MKYVKTLGLAVVAAAALMAFVGASTASATVLCKSEGGGPPTGTICPIAEGAYTSGQEIHGVSKGNIVLTTGSEFTEITCKAGTVKGTLEGEGSATETVKLDHASASEISWSECSTPNGACTVTTIAAGTLEIHWLEKTHNGKITGNEIVFTSSCASIFGTIHCIYKAANEDLGTLTGGESATADFESTPINIEPTSGLCPEGPKWDARYEITTPKRLYVAGHT